MSEHRINFLERRVDELLEANNREVERRRALEEEYEKVRLVIPSLLSARRFASEVERRRDGGR